MKPRLIVVLSILLTVPLGCTLPPTAPASPSSDWQNWQIQAGTATTSPPNTFPSFLGAIQIQATQAAGVFTTVIATGTAPQALDYTGGFGPSTGNVGLITQGYEFAFTEPATPNTITQVTVNGGCVGSPPPACLAIFTSPSVGAEIASLTGTFRGTITSSAAPSKNGTATLTLTQSSTPDSSGAFPLSATIVFPSASDLGTDPLTGTVIGEGLTLNFCSAAVIGPCISLSGSTNPAATQITITNLTFSDPGSNTFATFTGTLTRQ
jgi:hypothetical protein